MTPAERRRALIDDLRNLATRAPEFTWDFSALGRADPNCGCAIPRAYSLKLVRRKPINNAIYAPMARPFGLTEIQATDIFGNPEFYGVKSHADVTPEMVADALERVG